MHVLVIGSRGQVGTELMRASWPSGSKVSGLSRRDLDVTDPDAVDRVLRASGYSLVVNAAGYTAVDRAESDADAAFAVNRDGAAHVAAACGRVDLPLIHLSTDYVFDGAKEGAYVEDDPVAPISVYGRSKAAGEEEVRRRARRHIILRTSWVYGVHGNNFVKTMLRLGREQREVRVVDDQIGCPTAAADLASAITQLAAKLDIMDDRWGTYHLCGAGAVSWYRFAQRIFALCRQPESAPVLRPVRSQAFAAPARRPPNSRLDCRRIAAAFGIACPPWESSLARVLPEIEGSLK
jgi:dTDP-4-dehydrorhamnose reductase